MKYKALLVGSTALLLGGCFAVNTSQSPIATTYPVSNQQKMQSAHHWDVLAANEAAGLLANDSMVGMPLYIDAQGRNSIFSSTFKSLLTSSLVEQGANIRVSPDGSARLTYEVSLVEHPDRNPNRHPVGAWTALSAAVVVATVPFSNGWGEPAAGLIPYAIAADAWSGNLTDETDHEVVITTQVVVGDQVKYSSSNIYYVNGGDRGNYRSGAVYKTTQLTNQW